MKRRWIGVFTSVLCAVSMLIAPTTAKAGEVTWTGSAPGDNPTSGTIKTENGQASHGIDVNASVENAGDKIRYSVNVEYGEMQFVYDYGQVWDPETHTYAIGSSGRMQGGWVMNYVNGANNAISIENNSNYPVTAVLSYLADTPTGIRGDTAFNSGTSASADHAVIGIFSKSNSDFMEINTDPNLNGLNASGTVGKRTMTANIDWDYSQLVTSQYVDYGHLPQSDPNFNKYYLDVYFTLCGEPDANCWMASQAIVNQGNLPMTKVGTIKLEIKPCASATTDPLPTGP